MIVQTMNIFITFPYSRNCKKSIFIATSILKWFLDVKSTAVSTFNAPNFSFMAVQCNLHSPLHLGNSVHWRAKIKNHGLQIPIIPFKSVIIILTHSESILAPMAMLSGIL